MVSERIQRHIDRLLDEADEALTQFDWEAVQQRAQAVLALDPENDDALTFLAASERSLGTDDPPQTVQSQTPESPQVAQEPKTPTSFADGRYQVKRFLGEGGKKMVYLAQDTLLDRDVAFALIKTDGLDAISRTRISREAQAMGRLGSHPHIVTVFDLGDHEGQPFMVIELMGGGDVEAIIEDAEGGKLPLEQAISIAIETCRGLEFAHSKGIVHRDLKPGNVWLTADGIAKIGDFGLAVATDRSRLTAEGMMVGTVSYMPPEQAMGGEVTPKADLYSLGAMLYEMVCGRPPFLGDDNIAIIGQHINTPPVAPTWHRNDCPRPLEALIMRLLAKNPSERPESASDVLVALESIDASSSEQSITEPEQPANVLDSLAGDVFVGRQREMDDLKAALEDVLSGRGRMVTLVGEPGIGKTRTAQELATYARLRGAQVLWGRCYEEQGVPAYWPWVQAIRSYVREKEAEELSAVMGAGAADIAEVVSDVREKLPGLPRPQNLDSPESARFRLFDSIASFLKAASTDQPLMLVLDDLHWSDKPSLVLLQFVVREIGSSRILLVGTYRDMELNRQHPLSETLGDLTREKLFGRVLLRGLSQQDVGRFIEVASGGQAPDGLVSTVHAQTEGNPLFVSEVVKLLVQEDQLGGGQSAGIGQRETWTIQVPQGVKEVIGRRLNRLSARCNKVLTVAAVIGREFEMRLLDPLFEDLTQDMLLDVLEEALETRIIEELPTSIGTYQFTHGLMQETLIGELSLTRRVRLHARIAEALEALYGTRAEAYASELAHHFAQSEAVLGTEKLVRYSKLAGEAAIDRFAYEEALVHFERAAQARDILDHESEVRDEEAADILFGLARSRAGGYEAALFGRIATDLISAFDYFDQSNNIVKAIEVASFHYLTPPGVQAQLARITSRGIELVRPDSLEAGYILARHGMVMGREVGDTDAGLESLEQALTIAEREGDGLLKARVLHFSAHIAASQYKFQEAVEKALAAAMLARQVGDLPTEAQAHLEAAASLMSIGDPETARRHLTDQLHIARRMSDQSLLADGHYTQAKMDALSGDWATALQSIERVFEIIPNGLRMWRLRGMIENRTGNFEKGLPYIERWDEIRSSATIDNEYTTNTIRGLILAEIADLTNDLDTLDESLEIAQSVLRLNNPVPSAVQPSMATIGIVASLRNDPDLARSQYASSLRFKGVMNRMCEVLHDRILGRMCHTMGEFEDGIAHFEDAIAFCRKASYRPELANSLHDYAAMLLERNEPGDSEKATAMLDEALQISTDLGMRPLMERVLSKRDILKA